MVFVFVFGTFCAFVSVGLAASTSTREICLRPESSQSNTVQNDLISHFVLELGSCFSCFFPCIGLCMYFKVRLCVVGLFCNTHHIVWLPTEARWLDLQKLYQTLFFIYYQFTITRHLLSIASCLPFSQDHFLS